MYSGTDRSGWKKFWDKRKKSLTPSQLSPFYKNFAAMMGIIDKTGNALTRKAVCRREIDFSSRSVLEVGAGRGTMSDLFISKGYKTFCTDIENRLTSPGHSFIRNDILEKQPVDNVKFDITFTYGLLEHFNTVDKLTTIIRCLNMTKVGGVSMHYVVPKKWTNIREDKSVYRDACRDILKFRTASKWGIDCKKWGKKFLFPAWGKDSWECSKFMSKGFILWIWKYPNFE